MGRAPLRRPVPGSSDGRAAWRSRCWWRRARAAPPWPRPSPRPSWRTSSTEPVPVGSASMEHNKAPQPKPGGFVRSRLVGRSCSRQTRETLRSDGLNFLSLGAFRTLGNLELHALCLFERTVAARLDRGVVNEHVRAAAVLGNEAEALFSVEPLNSALCHGDNSFFVSQWSPHFADSRLPHYPHN